MLGLADRVHSKVLHRLWQWASQCHMGIGHDFRHLHHSYFAFAGTCRQPGHGMVSTGVKVQTRAQLRINVQLPQHRKQHPTSRGGCRVRANDPGTAEQGRAQGSQVADVRTGGTGADCNAGSHRTQVLA